MARARAIEETEAFPEADRLEGFPHPRETAALLGQDAAEQALAHAFAGGRMHHAWLLAGPEGIGKATLAYKLARFALARPAERAASAPGKLDVASDTSAARQVRALSHPGLLVLRRPYDVRAKRLGTTIPVDEVRRLKPMLGLTGGEDAWRVVIVDSANDLNISAANALLKSLEEPPVRVLFLLVSSEPSQLLPTIRSRCRRLDLAPLGGGELRGAVQAAVAAAGTDMPDAGQWPQLERLARGSVRRALQLAGSGGLELHQQIEAIFTRLPAIDWSAAHALSDQLGLAAQDQRFQAFFDLFLDHLAAFVRDRAAGTSPVAAKLIPEHRLPDWAALWETVLRTRNEADLLNLDRKALIIGTLAHLEATARG